jgi:hypothetical protein
MESLFNQGAFRSRANRAATLEWLQREQPAAAIRPKAEWMLLNSFVLLEGGSSITALEPQL